MSALSERDVRRLLLFKTLTALGFALFEVGGPSHSQR
jgi:hypothetical protein